MEKEMKRNLLVKHSTKKKVSTIGKILEILV